MGIRRGNFLTAVLLYSGLILIFMGLKLFPDQGLALGNHDTRGLFVPWLTFAQEAILSGKLPLWDAAQFAGNPFLSNPQVALFYPPTWLAVLLPVNIGISWHVALHLLVAAAGMFLLVRFLSESWLGGFVAGLVFAFSGFAMARIWAGHIGLLATNAWLPWILLGTAWAVQKRSSWAAVIGGVPWGLAILAGHSSSLFYLGLVWFLFLIYLGLTTKNWWLVMRQAVIGFILGLALSAVQLLPFLELSQHVARSAENSFEFATAFSLPPRQLATLAVPGYFGDPVNGYWGAPYFEELTFFAGILALVSFILIFQRPARRYWFYLGVAGLGLLLALGSYTPFYQFIYDLLPPLRLLRGPARAGILFVFASVALLGDVAGRQRVQGKEEGRDTAVLWLRVMLSIVLIAGVAGAAYTGSQLVTPPSAEAAAQLQLRLTGIIRATLLAFSGICLVWWLSQTKSSPQQRRLGAIALVILILVDLWGFGYKLVNPEPAGPHALWLDAQAIIGEKPGRVLPWGVNIFEQNGAGQVGLDSVFGYNTLEPQATIALAASQTDPRSQAYDVLGAGYVLAPVALEQYGDGDRPLQLLDHTENVWVYERARLFSLARLVTQYEVIPDSKAALERLRQPDFDPEKSVILDQQPPCDLSNSADSDGTAEIIAQSDGTWQIETDSTSPALLILSETAYPGWQVTVDGEQGESLLAYTALRAVCVPAGQHTVIWRFQPSIFLWGGAITLLALVLIGLAGKKGK